MSVRNRLLLAQHHLQFQERTESLDFVNVNASLADAVHAPPLLHNCTDAERQREDLAQVGWIESRSTGIRRQLRSRDIRARVINELTGAVAGFPQFQTTRRHVKKRVCLPEFGRPSRAQ